MLFRSVVLDRTGELLAYITARAIMTLGDVKRLVRRMGLRPERFVPPKHQPNYFDDVATEKFQAVFPGMNVTSPDDLIYYRTLVPYNPALVVISEVRERSVWGCQTYFLSIKRGEGMTCVWPKKNMIRCCRTMKSCP